MESTMDVSAATPLKQLYSNTTYQSSEGQRDRLNTDLSPAKVVKPAAQTNAVINERRSDPQAIDETVVNDQDQAAVGSVAVEPRFESDDRTNRLVYKVVDTSTGVVVQQLPTENALKLRAYAEQLNTDRSSAAQEAASVERTA